MKKQQEPKNINYALHKAQQLEILNSNIELLKNNVYGQTQVDIVLYALSTGMEEEEAVEYSLKIIDKMNEVNARRIAERRAEIEEKMKAANPQLSQEEPSSASPTA